MAGVSLVPAAWTTAKPAIPMKRDLTYGPNDQVQIALIGAGGMGNADADTATSLPGVKLVAACDL